MKRGLITLDTTPLQPLAVLSDWTVERCGDAREADRFELRSQGWLVGPHVSSTALRLGMVLSVDLLEDDRLRLSGMFWAQLEHDVDWEYPNATGTITAILTPWSDISGDLISDPGRSASSSDRR